MSFMHLGGMEVDCCDGCTGIWFDDGELEALPATLSERELAAEAVQALDGLRAPKAAVRREVRYVSCPVCDQPMNRRNYQQVSGIILNRCSGHGTWLDFVNTKGLLTILAEGRLPAIQERARSAEAEEIRREIAQAERARLDAAAHLQEAAQLVSTRRRGWLIRDVLWDILDFFD